MMAKLRIWARSVIELPKGALPMRRGANIGTGAGRRNGGAARLEKTVSRETVAMFHVKHICVKGGVGTRKHEKCKTTPCIKKSDNRINDMTMRRFCTSETSECTDSGAERADLSGERPAVRRAFEAYSAWNSGRVAASARSSTRSSLVARMRSITSPTEARSYL